MVLYDEKASLQSRDVVTYKANYGVIYTNNGIKCYILLHWNLLSKADVDMVFFV